MAFLAADLEEYGELVLTRRLGGYVRNPGRPRRVSKDRSATMVGIPNSNAPPSPAGLFFQLRRSTFFSGLVNGSDA